MTHPNLSIIRLTSDCKYWICMHSHQHFVEDRLITTGGKIHKMRTILSFGREFYRLQYYWVKNKSLPMRLFCDTMKIERRKKTGVILFQTGELKLDNKLFATVCTAPVYYYSKGGGKIVMPRTRSAYKTLFRATLWYSSCLKRKYKYKYKYKYKCNNIQKK